jgi:chorismate mutase
MSTPGDHDKHAGVLDRCRHRIDELDAVIVELLGERFDVARAVAEYKRDERIAMMAPDRVAIVRAAYLRNGAGVNLPPDFSAQLCDLVIDATCKMEDDIIDAPSPPPSPS